jgi:hypothetical protein
MNRFAVFAAAALAILALAAPAWAAPAASPAPAAEAPQAVVGHLTVYVNGNQVFDHDITDTKTKIIGYSVFDLYLVLAPGSVSLEVDGPLGFSPSFPVVGGPKHYDDTIPVHVSVPNPFGNDLKLDATVRVVLDLRKP